MNFKTGHQSIVNSIDRIQQCLRSYNAAKPFIRELSEKLLTHLAKQNDLLFDKLETFHRSNRQSAKTIEFLKEDLKGMKVKYLTFFDKYSGEMADLGSSTFPVDFTIFSKDILARLKIEEDYLLPLIEETFSH